MTEARKAVKKISKKLGLLFERGETYSYSLENIRITAYDDFILINNGLSGWCISFGKNESAIDIIERIQDICGRYIGLEAIE